MSNALMIALNAALSFLIARSRHYALVTLVDLPPQEGFAYSVSSDECVARDATDTANSVGQVLVSFALAGAQTIQVTADCSWEQMVEEVVFALTRADLSPTPCRVTLTSVDRPDMTETLTVVIGQVNPPHDIGNWPRNAVRSFRALMA